MDTLPLELLVNICDYVPRDSHMRSPTANLIDDEIEWHDRFMYQFDKHELSFYDFYFGHYENPFPDSDLWADSRSEPSREYLITNGYWSDDEDDDDIDSDSDSDSD